MANGGIKIRRIQSNRVVSVKVQPLQPLSVILTLNAVEQGMGCAALCRKLIVEAFYDGLSENPEVRADALRWINSPDFEAVVEDSELWRVPSTARKLLLEAIDRERNSRKAAA